MAEKLDCTELAQELAELAYDVAADPAMKNADDVFGAVKTMIPDVTREQVTMAIHALEKAKKAARLEGDISRFLSIKNEFLSEGTIRERLALKTENLKKAAVDPRKGLPRKHRNDTINTLLEDESRKDSQITDLRATLKKGAQLESDDFPGRTQGQPKPDPTTEEGRLRLSTERVAANRESVKKLEEQIADRKSRIALEELKPPEGPPARRREVSQQVASLKSELSSLNRELTFLRQKGKLLDELARPPEIDPGGKRSMAPRKAESEVRDLRKRSSQRKERAREIKRLDTQIRQLESENAAGSWSRREKRPGAPTDPELQARRDTLASLRRQKAELQEIGKIDAELEAFTKRGEVPATQAKPPGRMSRALQTRRELRAQAKRQAGLQGRSLEQKIADWEAELGTGKWKVDRAEYNRLLTERQEFERHLGRIVRAKRATEKLRKRFEAGDFAEPTAKPDPWDEAVERAAWEKEKIQARLKAEIDKARPKKPGRQAWEKVRFVADILRGLKLGAEFSPIFIQAGRSVLSRPITTAKSVGAGFRGMFSDLGETRAMGDIEKNPKFLFAKKSGIPFTDLTVREEAAPSSLVERLPVYKQTARFTRIFLNDLRMRLFDTLTDVNNITPDRTAAGKDLGNLIGVLTGRSNAEGMTGAVVDAVGVVALAPRLYLSHIEFLTGAPIWNVTDAQMRKVAMKEYARITASIGVLSAGYLIAQKLLDEDDENPGTRDPRSSSFMKAIVGEARMGIWPGQVTQYLTFLLRMAPRVVPFTDIETGLGKSVSSAGKVSPLSGPDASPMFNKGSVAGGFFRGRLNIGPSIFWAALSETDFMGKYLDPETQLAYSLNPVGIAYRDLAQMWMQELDMPRATAYALMTAGALAGLPLSVYGPETDANTENILESIKGKFSGDSEPSVPVRPSTREEIREKVRQFNLERQNRVSARSAGLGP